MTGEQLLAEGQRLARPCVYLRRSGNDLAAIWGGEGIVPCGDGPYRHWLTIDTRYIPGARGQQPACMSVYTNEEDCESGVVAVDHASRLLGRSDGLPLYAHADSSLPPLEAAFKLGSATVKDWLAGNGWDPEWGYNDNFADRKPVDFYEREYRRRLPLFTGEAHAVLGGWHIPWPDGDWDDLVRKRLIVWTFEESEPWVEVWEEGQGYVVIQRIT